MTLDSVTGRLVVIKYLKCTSVGCVRSAKIVDDLQFFLGVTCTLVKDIKTIHANAVFS